MQVIKSARKGKGKGKEQGKWDRAEDSQASLAPARSSVRSADSGRTRVTCPAEWNKDVPHTPSHWWGCLGRGHMFSSIWRQGNLVEGTSHDLYQPLLTAAALGPPQHTKSSGVFIRSSPMCRQFGETKNVYYIYRSRSNVY